MPSTQSTANAAAPMITGSGARVWATSQTATIPGSTAWLTASDSRAIRRSTRNGPSSPQAVATSPATTTMRSPSGIGGPLPRAGAQLGDRVVAEAAAQVGGIGFAGVGQPDGRAVLEPRRPQRPALGGLPGGG